jgi:hypothetical protein
MYRVHIKKFDFVLTGTELHIRICLGIGIEPTGRGIHLRPRKRAGLPRRYTVKDKVRNLQESCELTEENCRLGTIWKKPGR